MKTKLLFIAILLIHQLSFAQDSLKTEKENTRLFAFTPLSKKIEKVNGFAIGANINDIIYTNPTKKTVNGVNIDVNPLGILLICFYDTSKAFNIEDTFQQNGLNISAAGFLRNNSHNGLNISLYNYGNQMNGASFTIVGNVVEELNGIYFGFLGNYAEKGSGLTLGAFNEVKEFKGVQIGITNKSEKMKGLQIGLINKNLNGKSLQIGLWNKNEKRNFPLINWNFKKS